MRPIRPIALPAAARPFSLPLGPGPWAWRWGGWTVGGEGGRILRLGRGERPVSGEIPWPESSRGEAAALPGRIDGAGPRGEEGDGPTLLLPPGGDTAALIAGGRATLLSCEGSDFAAATDPLEPAVSALPMHAHRPLRAALETMDRGLSFHASEIDGAPLEVDAGPALFWAAAAAASPASSDSVVWAHLLAGLALGYDPPGVEALEELLRVDPVRGVRAAGTVGEWRDAPGLLAELKDSLIDTAGALAPGAAGPALDRETASAILTAAAALEGAGLRRGAAAVRGRAGSAPAPLPIVGRAEAMQEIRATLDAFTGSPIESVCDDAPSRSKLLRLPAAILFGFLGASGDAPFGRLRLAPTLTPRVQAFEVRGVRLGPARVWARYRLDEAGHTFTFEQTDGPVPVNLVLDLGIPEPPGRTWIDGETAEVDVVPAGAGCRARVQMPLDQPRVIRMERPG